MAAGGGRRAVIAAAVANGGLAAAKFVAFLFTGASSMLAEAIHSVADTSNQGLLLLGGHRARRAASELHAFGYGRERYFWSFVVAIVLFLLGGVFALFEGIEKLGHAHGLEAPLWAVGVLLVGIVLETYSMRTAIQESRPLLQGRSWVTFIRRARTPELPVVPVEDAGALFGLVLALLGIGLAMVTANPAWDAFGTISIGVLLTVIAVVLSVEMRSLLLGEAATRADVQKIIAAIRSDERVVDLLHLRTQHLAPDELLVAGKIRLDGGITFPEVAATIDELEEEIRHRVPTARMIYLEPGTVRDVHEQTVTP